MAEWTRREFVTVCAVAPLLSVQRPAAPVYVYVAESWRPLGRDPLVLGLLITANPSRHIDAIAAIKKHTRYRRRISHNSNDRFKIPFAREVMGYFARASDLRFAARVLYPSNSPSLLVGDFRAGQYPTALAGAGLKANAVVRLRRTKRSWYANSDILERRQAACARAITTAKAASRVELVTHGMRDSLIELNALLTGTLHWELSNALDSSAQSTLTRRLQVLLGVTTLTDPVKGRWQATVVGERPADGKKMEQ